VQLQLMRMKHPRGGSTSSEPEPESVCPLTHHHQHSPGQAVDTAIKTAHAHQLAAPVAEARMEIVVEVQSPGGVSSVITLLSSEQAR
jgi:hypothetical protein